MTDTKRNGLLIDYEYCTGCFACQVACCQEHGWEAPLTGIKVHEIVQDLPKGKAYLSFVPMPTELCVLCPKRIKKGLAPACVTHCMAACMHFGPVSELGKALEKKPRQVLWAPR
ncbi:MAG TPA: oxidoreductase [Desulfobacteraceae bacterium]|nr:oxidoreductase [Desulfobacteraceae bacterium]